jgi:hypothetical protein
MIARRSRGEGSLFCHEKRQRWIGVVSQGYAANGKRRTTLGEREDEDRGKGESPGGRSELGTLVCRPVAATTRCDKLSTHGWNMVWRDGIGAR